jgi:signal peptidase II
VKTFSFKKQVAFWLLFSFILILGDQFLKFWIKTSFVLTEKQLITSWFMLYFVENNGFAFGLEYFGEAGKFLLTLFRLILAGGVLFYFFYLVKNRAGFWSVLCFVLIFSGAVGNLIDSVFYGLFFSESLASGDVAIFLPDNGGYAPLFFGKVVDMFYFPIFEGFYPEWVPFLGGKKYEFFKYIFNLADSYITVGAFLLFFITPLQAVTLKKQ